MATTQSTPGQVEFLIKKYPGGKFSGLLDGGIAVGDELSLTGPYGTSTLKDGHVLPVVCVGGGAGMAPILSMLRHMSETASSRPVRFYYGARTAADLFYLDEIAEIRKGSEGFRVRGVPVGVDGRRRCPTRSRSRRATSPTSSPATRATSARPRSTCAARRRWWTPRWTCSTPVRCPRTRSSTTSFTSPIFD